MDCLGVCQGSTLRDACGVCGGSDLSGAHCNLNFSISISAGKANFSTGINVLNDASNNTQLSTYFLSLANSGNGSVKVELDIIGNTSKAPQITLTQSNFLIPSFSSVNVSFESSLKSLFTDSTAYFEPKIMLVKFRRLVVSDIFVSYSITLFPSSYNCGQVQNRNHCLNLPGCIFCLLYPSQRYLLESQYTPRRLFIDILPNMQMNYGPDYSYGECVDGWGASACSRDVASVNTGCSEYIANITLLGVLSLALFCALLNFEHS